MQISRTQFVLKFQQNQHLIEQRDQILADSSSDDEIVMSGNNYCIFYEADDEDSVKLKNNALQTLQYMKKKSTEVNTTDKQGTLVNCDVAIIAMDELEKVSSADKIDQFVFNGGYMLFMTMLDIDKSYQILYRKFGVSSFNDYLLTNGIHTVSNVLIGEKGLFLDDNFIINASISVGLDDGAELLAESATKTPLLWKNEYGDGAFITFNGTMLLEKMNRGFFAGALSLLEPNFIYPIFNTKVFFIDDFPAPIVKGKAPIIYEEYKKDTPSFFQEVWWPNMLQAATKYDIKYTGAIIESYNDRVAPPFNNTEDKDSHYLISYGRELIKSGGELGFHGYNHQSLVLDEEVSDSFGYNVWKNEADMSEAVEELLTYTKDAFPGYTITSYVPPSNVLSKDGREALKKVWPGLTVISSLYGEDASGMSYMQEFEVAKDGIIEMPRITSGYFETEYDHWAEANTMTALGVFSHFVHPDDVLSSDRSNNMGWEESYKLFNKYMERVQKTYPWVRAMPATEAALDVAKTLQTQISLEYEKNSIKGTITNFKSDTSYILRTKQKIRRSKNCTTSKIDKNTYLVIANDSKFTIELGES